jgi:AP-3 complex subunit beta
MDEWGQVVIVDLMARYCRRFFKEPKALKQGAAELIDQERRVHRRLSSGGQTTTSAAKTQTTSGYVNFLPTVTTDTVSSGGFKDVVSQSSNTGSYKDNHSSISRRVTTKGFYSDDEESSDEEVAVPRMSTAASMRQPPVVGNPTSSENGVAASNGEDNPSFDADLNKLDPDHQLLLTSSMPLLKSRNAGVVLAVCSLHYYCGVSSIKARSAIGKALVRIHRGRREIQYVVLTSIRVLVRDCPSAFAPFLPDFFVKVSSCGVLCVVGR